MMKKLALILIVLFSITASAYSQSLLRKIVVPPHPADSIDLAYYSRKNPWSATGQAFSLNMGIWAFDRYIREADFAYISMNTVKANFKHGFVWDNDGIGTNMFMHPYHGSLYYNAARSNGYNYWQSGLYSLSGSAMWELFMENEYPSLNDIMATPIGGLAVGEMLYRTSDLVLDDRRVGMHRFGRELAGFLIAPTRGLSRILTGDAWRRRSTSGKQFGVPNVSVEISSGVRILELRGKVLDKGIGFTTGINIEYGDRYASDNEKPFDYFTFRANLNMQGSQPLLGQVNIMGRLFVTDLVDKEKDFLNFGVYQHFDFYDSDTISRVSNKIPYKICTPAAVGVGLMYQSKRARNFNINGSLHLNLLMLGGALSDYYKVDQRNYNIGSGFGTKAIFGFAYKDKFAMNLRSEMYRLFTWKGYPQDVDWDAVNIHDFDFQGDQSQAILHVNSLNAELKINEHVYLTGIFANYVRETNYKYFDKMFSRSSEGRMMLTYKF